MIVTPRITISEKSFENLLCLKYPFEQLTKSHYQECLDEGEVKNMTLYYFNDAHCATWMEGEGWEFVDAAET